MTLLIRDILQFIQTQQQCQQKQKHGLIFFFLHHGKHGVKQGVRKYCHCFPYVIIVFDYAVIYFYYFLLFLLVQK